MSFRLWKYKEPLYLNNFGIMEPRYSNQKLIPDLILVPLVAYDEKFNRIGYGKGYYDRSLKKIKKNKKKYDFFRNSLLFSKILKNTTK